MNSTQFILKLSNLSPRSTFLSIMGYRNASSEVANYSINFNIDYKNALKNSITYLNKYVATSDLEEKARIELISGFKKSLLKSPEELAKTDSTHYEQFVNADNQVIKGLKLHKKSNEVHLFGLVVHKKVLMPGSYKEKNYGDEYAKVKDQLRAKTSVGKFRQFKINADQVNKVSVNKISITAPK